MLRLNLTDCGKVLVIQSIGFELKEGSEGEMTTADKVIKTKVGLLELGKQLGDVTKACRVMGYSETVFIGSRSSTRPGGEAALQEVRGASRT